MKKFLSPLITVLLACCWLTTPGLAQNNWQGVGTNGLVAASAADQSLFVDAKGTSYIAYRDEANGYKITVKKFNGTTWQTVGPAGFSVSYANSISLAVDGNGIPYVAYTDNGTAARATVKKYDGASWVEVGTTGFAVTFAYGVSMAIDGNNVPYVAYSDLSKSGRATVKKFIGGSWVSVGLTGFSTDHANGISLIIDTNNTLYVAYSDNALKGKATVKKYADTSWTDVGTAGFTSSYANNIALTVDAGTPYVLYRDEANGYKATVKKYNGSAWADLGAPGFSTGDVRYTSLAAKDGLLYAAYVDYGTGFLTNSGTVTVRRFNGSNWMSVGPTNLITAAGKAFDLVLTLPSGATPCLAYSSENGGWNATVLKLAASTAPNQAPVANAGTNKKVNLPTNLPTVSIMLEGSGTDADGTVSSYAWRQVSGPAVGNFNDSMVATPIVSGLIMGNYTFRLTVKDNQGTSSVAATVIITVEEAINVLPVASAGADLTITLPIASTSLTGLGTDIDGLINGYAWSQVSGPNTATFSSPTNANTTVSGLVAGTYTFSLLVTDNRNGSSADQVTVIVLPDPIQRLLSFTLVNADTGQDLLTLANGTTINLANLPTTNLNIRANTYPTNVGSVLFTLSGTRNITKTNNGAPYSFYGDVSGKYTAWIPPVGSYTLVATPYTEINGVGIAGVPITISFTVTNIPPASSIKTVSLTLVNADTGQDLLTLANGTTINLATLPTKNLNIRANLNSTAASSVLFTLSGTRNITKTNNGAPYSFYGDVSGKYTAWIPPVGSYTLVATPYTSINGTGTAGTALTVSFSVVDKPAASSATTLASSATQPIESTATVSVSVYPNPATDKLYVTANQPGSDVVTVTLYDLTGTAVLSQQVNTTAGGLNVALPVDQLPAGRYVLVAESAQATIAREHVVVQ